MEKNDTFEREIARALTDSVKHGTFEEVGAGSIPPIDLDPIVKDDILEVPDNPMAYQIEVGRPTINPVTGEEVRNKAVFTIVQAEHEFTEGTGSKAKKRVVKSTKRFFITGLTRSALPSGETDNSKRVRPSGSVIDFIQNHCTSMDQFWQAAAGYKIRVTDIQKIPVRFQGRTEDQNVNVYTLDWEGNEPEAPAIH